MKKHNVARKYPGTLKGPLAKYHMYYRLLCKWNRTSSTQFLSSVLFFTFAHQLDMACLFVSQCSITGQWTWIISNKTECIPVHYDLPVCVCVVFFLFVFLLDASEELIVENKVGWKEIVHKTKRNHAEESISIQWTMFSLHCVQLLSGGRGFPNDLRTSNHFQLLL